MILYRNVEELESIMTHLYDWYNHNCSWYPFEFPYFEEEITMYPVWGGSLYYEVLWGDVR